MNGAPHSHCSPGSYAYRQNLTIAESDDGGAPQKVNKWGLVYSSRVSYSDMSEFLGGKVAIVCERITPFGEYRYLAFPPWTHE